MVALMVRQNVSLLVAGPIRVGCRAPLPRERKVVIARLSCVVESGLASAGDIGIDWNGISIEKYLVA